MLEPCQAPVSSWHPMAPPLLQLQTSNISSPNLLGNITTSHWSVTTLHHHLAGGAGASGAGGVGGGVGVGGVGGVGGEDVT